MNQNNLILAASYLPNSLPFPSAWIGHLPFAAWLIKEIAPKIFVELGTHWGHSYFSFCKAVTEANISTKCYAVDTWKGDEHAGYYGEEVFEWVDAHNKENYARFSRLLRMSFDDAIVYFSDRSIDLLHIDGMHTYDAVKHDFESWLPKLAPGGIVLIHDTNVREHGFGVWKLWEEIQVQYSLNIEFTHSHGLGVLQLNDSKDGKIIPWLNFGALEQKVLKNYFYALGERQIERFELIELHKTVTALYSQIDDLNQTLTERDGQIVSTKQAINDCELQVTNLNQTLAERNVQIDNLNHEMAERERLINIMLTSTRWKVTVFLRFVGRQMKLIKNLWRRDC